MKKSVEERIEDTKRMAIIETDINHIKQTLNRSEEALNETNRKMDSFINSANKIYATKLELDSLRQSVDAHRQSSRDWVKTIIPWIFAGLMFVLALVNILLGVPGVLS